MTILVGFAIIAAIFGIIWLTASYPLVDKALCVVLAAGGLIIFARAIGTAVLS